MSLVLLYYYNECKPTCSYFFFQTKDKKFYKGSELKAKEEEEYNKKYGSKTEDVSEKHTATDTGRYILILNVYYT